jgi:tetratricopeptide (TPR) repeat protein
MQKIVIRILASIMLIFTLYFYIQILYKDNAVKQIIYDKKANQENSDVIFNNMVYYSQAELIAVAVYNQQLLSNSINFRLINYYADQLLQANNRSSQALYFKAVVSDSKGNVSSAINFVEKALKYDPNNVTYLIGLSILKISIGDLKQIDSIINKIKVIDPENSKIVDIEDEFDRKIKELDAKSK